MAAPSRSEPDRRSWEWKPLRSRSVHCSISGGVGGGLNERSSAEQGEGPKVGTTTAAAAAADIAIVAATDATAGAAAGAATFILFGNSTLAPCISAAAAGDSS